jgi:CNT family concentrative nucleoside transporter
MTHTVLQAFLGIIVFFTFCWFFSENRRQIKPLQIILGLLAQFTVAALIMHVEMVRKVFVFLSKGVIAVRDATLQGTSFVFGFIGGGPLPFEAKGNTFVFAFQVLPMIMVVSALAMLLFYWRILPAFVKVLSFCLRKTLGIGGALGVCSAAQIFLGQTEAPLLVRPYLKNMSRSEIFSIMCMGFATTSATIMGLYALVLEQSVPQSMVHILTASIISIPAALSLSRMVVPPSTQTAGEMVLPYEFSGSMDAISRGTSDGIRLFINVLAMLIVFVALVALANKILGLFPNFMGEAISLQRILGFLMAPLSWLMGIPWAEAKTAGSLLGIKTILNEFYAFTELAKMGDTELSVHSRVIMTYALCGFANISSMGIVIGGFGGLVPEKRAEIISLSVKALIVGTLASCLSGSVVGILWWAAS